MNRLITGIALLALAATSPSCANPAADAAKAVTSEAAARPKPPADSAAAETLRVTGDNSRIEFVGSKVTGSEGGRFEKFSGTVYLVEAAPEKSRVEIAIDMNSVATDSGGLAEHLKTADFFDAPKFPEATFVTTDIRPGGEKGATHTVTGNLDLHGVKKAVTFPATIKVDTAAATLDAEFAISRKDFGIMYAGRANDLIRDEVLIKLHVRAPRADRSSRS
ncbi:MAG TPA: YceI family protein [Pyrinomonadaceae bacterium]|nr:YceI family protein [Pyrinomonadaceae bacterium]